MSDMLNKANILRPRPRLRPKLWCQGRGQSQDYEVKAEAKTNFSRSKAKQKVRPLRIKSTKWWWRINLQNISLSQCSTVVRNTVVRATIKVNGKPQILGTCSPQTSESIDSKFDLDDYVCGVTLRAKNGTNRNSNAGGAKGWNIMFKNGYFFFLFVYSSRATLLT